MGLGLGERGIRVLAVAATVLMAVAAIWSLPRDGDADAPYVVPVQDAGTVILRQDPPNLEVTSTNPADGWTVNVVTPLGPIVTVQFQQGQRRLDMRAELTDARVLVQIQERLAGSLVDQTVTELDERQQISVEEATAMASTTGGETDTTAVVSTGSVGAVDTSTSTTEPSTTTTTRPTTTTTRATTTTTRPTTTSAPATTTTRPTTTTTRATTTTTRPTTTTTRATTSTTRPTTTTSTRPTTTTTTTTSTSTTTTTRPPVTAEGEWPVLHAGEVIGSVAVACQDGDVTLIDSSSSGPWVDLPTNPGPPEVAVTFSRLDPPTFVKFTVQANPNCVFRPNSEEF